MIDTKVILWLMQYLFLIWFFCVFCHELGHAYVSWALGYRTRIIRYGTAVETGVSGQFIPPIERVMICTAGPMANIFVALCLPVPWYVKALCIDFAFCNLFPFFKPFRHSDGRQTLDAILEMKGRNA